VKGPVKLGLEMGANDASLVVKLFPAGPYRKSLADATPEVVRFPNTLVARADPVKTPAP
jgi:hypothetical protein